jgi:DNA-binding response OmpR family regulator
MRLMGALQTSENPRYLTTVRGFGYRFEESS